MSDLNPTSRPSSSGARIGGDDLQYLVAWYWCLKMLNPSAGIARVCVEADVDGNLDDVAIERDDGQRYYIQVKSSVSAKSRANVGWLMTKRSPSSKTLIQKLYDSWDGLGRPGRGIELISSRPMDPDDPLFNALGRKNTVGIALRRAADRKLSGVRQRLSSHIPCTEADLCEFFDALRIRVGQTESEWRSRVGDVALGVGIRYDDSAILAALGWIREWVKDTRDPRSAQEVEVAVEQLDLRVEAPRPLVVIQGIDSVPCDGAVEILQWTEKFRGDAPENRRGLIDPSDWNGTLSNDLRALKERLLAGNHKRVLLRGALRLPCWFAIGATLREVAGFSIAMDYRGALWPADMSNLNVPDVEIRSDEFISDGRTVVVVTISTDATSDVRSGLVNSSTGRIVTIGLPGGPSPSSLKGPPDAMAAAVAMRNWARRNILDVEIDLVLMAPAPFALFLGHLWDRIVPTTIHEDLVSGYEPAFRFSNSGD